MTASKYKIENGIGCQLSTCHYMELSEILNFTFKNNRKYRVVGKRLIEQDLPEVYKMYRKEFSGLKKMYQTGFSRLNQNKTKTYLT